MTHPAFHISKTGMLAQDAKLAAIANNLANVNTVGYKRDRLIFEDMPYQVERMPGSNTDDNNNAPLGIQFGTGTRLIGTQKIFTTGNLTDTKQNLDLAIVGQGFFQVKLDSGETGYSRAGQLQLNANGQLVTPQGLPLQPEIVIPANATNIMISDTGVVTVTANGSNTATELGQITLGNFLNPAGLQAIGSNLFLETVASGTVLVGNPGSDGLGKLKQGTLEGSNVEVVTEMVELMSTQRNYEFIAKVLSAADHMLQQLAQATR